MFPRTVTILSWRERLKPPSQARTHAGHVMRRRGLQIAALVVIHFVAPKVCEPAGTIGYDVRERFLANFNGGRVQVLRPLRLSLHSEVAGGRVRRPDGPSCVHIC